MTKLEAGNVAVVKNESGTEIRVGHGEQHALLIDLTDEEVVALHDLLGQHPVVLARRESAHAEYVAAMEQAEAIRRRAVDIVGAGVMCDPSVEFVPPPPLPRPLPPSFMLLFSASSKQADVIEYRLRAPDGRLLARGEHWPKEPKARIVAYPYDLEALQPFRHLFLGLFLELERLR